ncbi:PIR protein [Plasmodium yoelii]|uniref:PIR protein n=2 Tax=Plasmodium yoelii TaxID=5861 RepID=A0AAE9WIF4_PLAYO|nr:PIR protein [Plasmodium yoelii]WBY54393.1 PIR protein [Plasmodium yoelii yoelii]CDS44701.1 YIR protein [Plasmodium yoelii]VTZ71412.1 PIR protein [Plasmodium yoelii]|eukprot:XP_022810940.2 PIR protein [Plasmodium yoelii]
MNKQVSEKFENLWEFFPDKLTSDKKYQINKGNFLDGYCDSYRCDSDFEKISAGLFYLLNQFFGPSGLLKNNAKNKNDIFDYIMIWLSYMLNLKENESNDSLKYFYNTDIKHNQKYTNSIAGFTEYNNYKELLDDKQIVNIDINNMSKFYVPFKSLCTMYNGFNDSTSDCTKYLNDVNEFANKYKELSEDSSIANDSFCNKILCTLSNDYDNFKKKCKDSSSFPTIKKPNIIPKCPEQISEQNLRSSGVISEDVASSSSITSKLFTVLSIFGAIAFFLGISYKYSLFGFRKRFKKQQIREKIKNIKKRMNH